MPSFNAVENLLQEGNYYEAHQMTLTIVTRLSKQKKYESALEILQEAIIKLARVQQMKSANDLAVQFANLLKQTGYEKYISWILDICQTLSPPSTEFAKEIISATLGQEKQVFHALGQKFYENGMAKEAMYCLVNGKKESLVLLASLLQHRDEEERRSSLISLILTLLSQSRTADAWCLFQSYVSGAQIPVAEKMKDSPYACYQDALYNFGLLLILAVQRRAKPLFQVLKSRYQAKLEEESKQLLSVVGNKVFGIPAASSNPLQSLLGGLFQQ